LAFVFVRSTIQTSPNFKKHEQKKVEQID